MGTGVTVGVGDGLMPFTGAGEGSEMIDNRSGVGLSLLSITLSIWANISGDMAGLGVGGGVEVGEAVAQAASSWDREQGTEKVA